jgi:hypothetical protein
MGSVTFPRRSRLGLVLGLAALSVGWAPAAAEASRVAGVAGRVLHADQPVANAAVYAYQVVERSFRRVATDRAGEFLFEALPAGLYKIVAHKVGVAPAVLVLVRRAAEDVQYVQVELAGDETTENEDFWALRARVPSDVLRELGLAAGAADEYEV